jgi:hypothetical protein
MGVYGGSRGGGYGVWGVWGAGVVEGAGALDLARNLWAVAAVTTHIMMGCGKDDPSIP